MSATPPPGRPDLATLLEDERYIDDAEFSDRVVKSLPPRRARRTLSYVLVPAFTSVACALAYAIGGRFMTGSAGSAPLTMTSPVVAFALALMVVAAAALVSAEE